MKSKFRKERYIQQRCVNGVWSFRVRYNGIDKLFNEKDYLTSYQAFENAVEYRNKLLVNKEIVAKNVKVDDCFKQIEDIYSLRGQTIRKLEIIYGRYIQCKDKQLSKVTRADILNDLNAMVDTCSNDNIQRCLSIWKKIYGVGIAKGYIAADMTLQIKAPSSRKLKTKKRYEYIDEETLNKVIDLCEKKTVNKFEKQQPYYSLWSLYYTGMRPAELFALTKDDIDFKNRTINVNKELGCDRDRKVILRSCKTEMSHRVVPISDKLYPILKKAVTLHDFNILFPNDKGEYQYSAMLGSRYHLIVAKHGIDFHMYQCRHAFITNLFMKGVDLKTIQEIVGQVVDSTTIGYVVTDDDRKKIAVNLI